MRKVLIAVFLTLSFTFSISSWASIEFDDSRYISKELEQAIARYVEPYRKTGKLDAEALEKVLREVVAIHSEAIHESIGRISTGTQKSFLIGQMSKGIEDLVNGRYVVMDIGGEARFELVHDLFNDLRVRVKSIQEKALAGQVVERSTSDLFSSVRSIWQKHETWMEKSQSLRHLKQGDHLKLRLIGENKPVDAIIYPHEGAFGDDGKIKYPRYYEDLPRGLTKRKSGNVGSLISDPAASSQRSLSNAVPSKWPRFLRKASGRVGVAAIGMIAATGITATKTLTTAKKAASRKKGYDGKESTKPPFKSSSVAPGN